MRPSFQAPEVLLELAVEQLTASVTSWEGTITRLNLIDLLLKTPVGDALAELHVPEDDLAECVERVITREHLDVRGA